MSKLTSILYSTLLGIGGALVTFIATVIWAKFVSKAMFHTGFNLELAIITIVIAGCMYLLAKRLTLSWYMIISYGIFALGVWYIAWTISYTGMHT